jgi:hypothetical protein
LAAVSVHRSYLLAAFAILVAGFVALYPYLGAVGLCDHGDAACPYMVQSSHTSSASALGACVFVMLAASPIGVVALALLRRRRVAAAESRPEDIFLPPNPPPPQLS